MKIKNHFLNDVIFLRFLIGYFEEKNLFFMNFKAVAEKSKAVTPKPFIFKSIHDLISGHKSALLDMVNLLTGKRREKFGLYSDVNIYLKSPFF